MTDKNTKTKANAWRRLYAAADMIRKLEPWKWMEETDVFGVQFPGTEEIGYVSIMGNVKVHFAISVYLGDEALNKFWDIEDTPATKENAERILEVPQLMASFEDRDILEKRDRDAINKLGLKYRGNNNWPLFRSYRPGFYPWFLEQDEIEKLTIALEQTAGIAMRMEDDPAILDMGDERDLLVRVLRNTGDKPTWEDSVRTLPPPTLFNLTFSVPNREIEKLKSVPRDIRAVEVAFSLSPARVGKPGQRPTFTYMLLVVEPESFFILGTELMEAKDGLHKMWESIPASLVSILNKKPFLPREIRVSDHKLYQFFAPLQNELGIKLSFVEHLPAVEDAMNSLRNYMQG